MRTVPLAAVWRCLSLALRRSPAALVAVVAVFLLLAPGLAHAAAAPSPARFLNSASAALAGGPIGHDTTEHTAIGHLDETPGVAGSTVASDQWSTGSASDQAQQCGPGPESVVAKVIAPRSVDRSGAAVRPLLFRLGPPAPSSLPVAAGLGSPSALGVDSMIGSCISRR